MCFGASFASCMHIFLLVVITAIDKSAIPVYNARNKCAKSMCAYALV